MDIANEILARKRLVPDKAEEYGFARAENGDMTYSSPLMDGELTCLITASEERQVKCIVIDSDTGDEYTPVRIDSYRIGKVIKKTMMTGATFGATKTIRI